MGRALTAAILSALLAVACTSAEPTSGAAGTTNSVAASDRATSGSATPQAEPPPGIVRLQGCEPRSLLPADAPRSCGQQVLRGLFTMLVELNPRDGSPRWGLATDDAVASSVTSTDAQRWHIELEDEWQFHDGTPVTATSFVDAWNFAAYSPNGQANAFLFQPIEGFEELHCPEPGCEPADDDMDGLRAIDDRTIEVVLTRPDRSFPRRLGHVAFAPLPPAAFDDPDAFAEAPAGNGPFRMEGTWTHGDRISLRAVEEHPGGTPAVDGVDVVIVENAEQAWQALQSGRLDVARALPATRLDEADAAYERVVRAGDDYEALVVPSYLPDLAEDARLARALSMAIDRRALIADHLAGRARPARGLVPDVVSDGTDRCGTLCRFDPVEARSLLAEVGLPAGGIELWYDRSGGHEAWVRGVARDLRQHLELAPEQVRVRSLSHTSWLTHLQDRRVDGLYPIGWSMDVASAGEYLEELHGPGGLFNFDRYRGADVVDGLTAAARATSELDAQRAYRQLERELLDDMHHIPLWTRTHILHHTSRVAQVEMDGKGNVRFDALRLADDDAG